MEHVDLLAGYEPQMGPFSQNVYILDHENVHICMSLDHQLWAVLISSHNTALFRHISICTTGGHLCLSTSQHAEVECITV